VSPKPVGGLWPQKKGETGRQTDTQGIPSEDEGIDWQRAIYKPRNTEDHQQTTKKLGERPGRDSPSWPQKETNTADILI